jgi:hypothetical protein
VLALCRDGALKVLELELDGESMDAAGFFARFGKNALPLTNAAA